MTDSVESSSIMTRDDHDDHQPLIIDPKSSELPMDYSASKSCSLEKKSGNKCYMIGARELTITWVDTPQYWKWTSCSESRFSEIASLQSVWWLDIRGKIDTQMLSGKTTYGAYLVFNLSKKFGGLGSANSVVRFVDHEAVSDAEKRANLLHLKRAPYGEQSSYESVVQRRRFAKRRGDGWMEIELGSFYIMAEEMMER